MSISGAPTRSCPNFQIGGGGEYVGSRYAQTTAPIEQVPGYMTLDAMARNTPSTTECDVQVNVYNLTDKLLL